MTKIAGIAIAFAAALSAQSYNGRPTTRQSTPRPTN